MKRLFWVALGAVGGVLVVRRVGKAVQSYTPGGVAANLGSGLSDLAEALRQMAEVVREGMSQREAELRDALGLDTGLDSGTDGQPSMSAEQARSLLDDPTGPRAR
ncbi:MAG TPA: hypothetical protein VFJ97_15260 [Dermatophilaceae bacterium]|nr:hypothetical protein [Dermatophilaceae bacterium]